MNTDLILHPLSKFILPALLYAEVHYKIFGLPSRYFINEPEIVADMPSRIEPGHKLPVLLLVKDSQRFPITLNHIEIQIQQQNIWQELTRFQINKKIEQKALWAHIFQIDVNKLDGHQKIKVIVHYNLSGTNKSCVSDNYKQSPHDAFDVLIDSDPLPRESNCYYGDLHTHSDFTSDQVEFGAPLADTKMLAKSMGLDFFAATDHSYDLDDSIDDYLQNDPELPKWKLLWDEIDRLNSWDAKFKIIPGQELSVGTAKNRNVHMLVLNNKTFFHGSGDSAEKWLQTKPENHIPKILAQLEPHAAGIAAHPEIAPPFIQWLLVRRGKWEAADYNAIGLHGVQMWNGDKAHFLEHGLPKWKALLLSGKKIGLFGGTDAHGNFNIFRQIGLPHVKMKIQHKEVFATVRTGLMLDGELTVENMMTAIQQHRAIVTDGPFASLTFQTQNREYNIGETCADKAGKLSITAHSTRAFGAFQHIRVIAGKYAAKKESIFLELVPNGLDFEYLLEMNHSADYLRLEAYTKAGTELFICFTNPIYFK